ncbi:MAG: immunity protein Imm33 domain-containing protein [Telluria sp.]
MTTRGLRRSSGREISATISDRTFRNECLRFLHFVADYMRTNRPINPEETLGYGYWITKAMAEGDDLLSFWEYDDEAVTFVPGITLTLRYWRDQHLVCDQAVSVFSPPRVDQLVVVSDGVLEGEPVQGVRYPSPEHMSGWWITTDRYNGDVATLKTLHAYHLTATRPDLARYLGLAYGFRFYSEDGRTQFDPKAMT